MSYKQRPYDLLPPVLPKLERYNTILSAETYLGLASSHAQRAADREAQLPSYEYHMLILDSQNDYCTHWNVLVCSSENHWKPS